MFKNGGTNFLGLILRSRKDEILFRHPTRQLTSSAKRRRSEDRQTKGAFLFCHKTKEQLDFDYLQSQ